MGSGELMAAGQGWDRKKELFSKEKENQEQTRKSPAVFQALLSVNPGAPPYSYTRSGHNPSLFPTTLPVA